MVATIKVILDSCEVYTDLAKRGERNHPNLTNPLIRHWNRTKTYFSTLLISAKLWTFNPPLIQGRNHVFRVGGLNLMVYGITTLLQKKIRQVYPVWCSRLHNHPLFINKVLKRWRVRPNIFGGSDSPRPTSGCAHASLQRTKVNYHVNMNVSMW